VAYNAPMVRRLTVLAILVAASAVARGAPRLDWQAQTSGVQSRLRGISAVSDRVAWASGGGGTVLRTSDGGATWERRPIAGAEQLDVRDIDAMSAAVAYALSIGPGESSRIYKTIDGGAHWILQFANTHPKVFLDAMAFWDPEHGIAFSDSVDGQFVVLKTVSGGREWEQVAADWLPAALPGEGAFAASGTNVATHGGNLAWIGTTAGRVLRTTDAGRSWKIANTPIHTGDSAGIFSIAFLDAMHGVVVGGDYKEERDAFDNAAVTNDGGVTWSLVKGHGLSGFRSVVGWVSGTPHHLLALGPSGGDVSTDNGTTWTPLAAEGFDTLSLVPRSHAGWAAGDHGRIAKLTIHD
jgi:photosystem II stability/assembly factor-like uncharacterized protein